MTNEPDPNNFTNRSGGSDIEAGHDTNIGGDVVGRDKLVSIAGDNVAGNKIELKIELPPASNNNVVSEDTRTAHIHAIIDLTDEILASANESLIENEETLIPFLQNPSNKSLTRDALLRLFEKQRNRGSHRRWLTILREYRSQETDAQLQAILDDLLRAVDSLYETFYSYSGAVLKSRKWFLLRRFEAIGDNEPLVSNLLLECRAYLDCLRQTIEVIADCSGRLNALILI